MVTGFNTGNRRIIAFVKGDFAAYGLSLEVVDVDTHGESIGANGLVFGQQRSGEQIGVTRDRGRGAANEGGFVLVDSREKEWDRARIGDATQD